MSHFGCKLHCTVIKKLHYEVKTEKKTEREEVENSYYQLGET